MAHFYGDIQGNRGEGTRGGTRASGMRAHIRGWHVGAKVWLSYNEDTGKDEVTLYITNGSSNSSGYYLGTWVEPDNDNIEPRKREV